MIKTNQNVTKQIEKKKKEPKKKHKKQTQDTLTQRNPIKTNGNHNI